MPAKVVFGRFRPPCADAQRAERGRYRAELGYLRSSGCSSRKALRLSTLISQTTVTSRVMAL